ncbi:ThiF family adenylyltransferase [Dokdonella immobilis]|uniref:ThiF family protein n=1 Tax=Dokdonella immobilis TaxID=578942 RepID=A0A1I5B0H6_9GAMM|nr:ThiF family adenylyltransferase [Dokdonella immobilis]SFN67979.1 ThiF family protein [Dokdonella immobilis]
MADTFYELCNVTEIASAEALTIPRARALFNAIERHRDYSIVQLLQQTKDGAPTIECLIVDVECDGVPSKNQFGIAYRERLALCVPSDPKRLIDVLALRRDFPELMHLNQGLPGAPASLCLYFESPAAVLRTWTPPAFLRRIQWWLERSARGELHPADQPVEQMFFASQYELILPWNYAKLREDLSARFVVFKGPERPNGGFTCYMEAVSGAVADAKTAAHIDLLLPPVTHGFIEHNPGTLGELSDILGKRSVDLIGLLRDMIQTKVDEKGAIESPDDKATVIVVLIPIRRSAEADPDGIMRRAFFVPSGIVEVGIATGALFKYDGRYFRDSTNSEPTTAWRDLPVLLMDVLTKNDGASARRQSAVLEEGPTGVLVGAGSLGSALLNLWGRSGFGRWSVIDDDHIKPHNLSRHVAFAQHIGQAKATVVAELHDATMEGATRIAPITADASDFSQQPVAQVLNVASLVVDASTTLEYPRAASANDALPRHCSTFVTPDGNGAVLLMEDVKRSQRLRTLEAQYYREIIQCKRLPTTPVSHRSDLLRCAPVFNGAQRWSAIRSFGRATWRHGRAVA